MAIYHVSTVEEARAIVESSDPSIDLQLAIRETCPLNEARRLFKAVRYGGGGRGTIQNPEILAAKDDAYQVVRQKLQLLRRRIVGMDKVLAAIDGSLEYIEQVLADGGPGVPTGFEPHAFRGLCPYIDPDELVDDEYLEIHIAEMKAIILESTPGSPAAEGEYSSEDNLNNREEQEQMVITEFNREYLEVKREALATDRDILAQGLQQLEEKYLHLPTRLGSGTSDFVRFEDHQTYPGEFRKNMRY